MTKQQSILVFMGIVLSAVALRLHGINWDQGHYYHPDERAIIMKTADLRWPDHMNPKFFAYGSFPFYLLMITSSLTKTFVPQFGGFDNMFLFGRALSVLFDLGTLIFIYRICVRLKNQAAGLLASLMYGLAVLPIQLSHFYAVDTMLTFFITASLSETLYYSPVRSKKTTRYVFVCIMAGAAMATKISAVVIALPIFLALIFHEYRNLKRLLLYGILISITVAITFFICQPYALLDYATFWEQIRQQQAMTKNPFVFPYTLQYVNKIPYWHEIKNVFLWGLGPVLSTLSIIGILSMTLTTLRHKHVSNGVILAFFWTYFLIVGKFSIGFMRYMLPVYPIFCIAAAILTVSLLPKRRKYRVVAITVLALAILIWPISFSSIYNSPNTRNTASQWLDANAPAGSVIAQEHWDDGIANPDLFTVKELPLYDPDTEQKWEAIHATLSQSDYIVIASHRLYVPLMKLTDCARLPRGKCYKRTAAYYDALFHNRLGFQLAASFTVLPTIPFLLYRIDDSPADESFTVYDHPRIFIFQKVGPIPVI